MSEGLRIDYNEAANTVVLEGPVSQLYRDPAIAIFLRNQKAIRTPAGTVEFRVEPHLLERKFHSLSELVKRMGIVVIQDAQLSGTIRDIQRGEQEFESFSEKALDIWKARFEAAEFDAFLQVLARECPGRTFYRLQLLAAYHLAFSQHACNFSVPGAGKTSIVYAAYAYLKSLGQESPKYVNHLLIVGPLSSFKVWEEEFRDIFLKPPQSKRIAGFLPPSERAAYLRGHLRQSFSCELTLTSYASLANSREDFSAFMKVQSRCVMMVLDEAHYIKADDGVWANAALELAKNASARVVLTGTPVPNGYEDLTNLFRFLYPTRDIVGYSSAALKAMSQGKQPAAATERLRERVKPFYTRIGKSDLDLGEPRHVVVPVRLGESHNQIYRYIEDSVIPGLERDETRVADVMNRARLMRLRQAATNPALLLQPLEEEGMSALHSDRFSVSDAHIFDLINKFDPRGELGKLDALRELIQTELRAHTKVLVWSIFIKNLQTIKDAVKDLFDTVDIIYGATPIDDLSEEVEGQELFTRERIISSFQHSSGRHLLVANPHAIGESISLHQACHVAVYFDRDFNAGRFIQSKDRIHRYGLPRDQLTEYYYLVAPDTVESTIHDRLLFKEQRLKDLIDGHDIPLFQLVLGDDEEREDIRAIIKEYEHRKRLT